MGTNSYIFGYGASWKCSAMLSEYPSGSRYRLLDSLLRTKKHNPWVISSWVHVSIESSEWHFGWGATTKVARYFPPEPAMIIEL